MPQPSSWTKEDEKIWAVWVSYAQMGHRVVSSITVCYFWVQPSHLEGVGTFVQIKARGQDYGIKFLLFPSFQQNTLLRESFNFISHQVDILFVEGLEIVVGGGDSLGPHAEVRDQFLCSLFVLHNTANVLPHKLVHAF